MSTVPRIVSRTRTRKTPESGGFSVRRINATFNELSRDLQELQGIYNNTLRPLIEQLPLGKNDADNAQNSPIGDSLDALKNGLSGDQIWTDNTATLRSSKIFWDSGRKLTIKESLLKLSEMLDASIAQLNTTIVNATSDATNYTVDSTTMNSSEFTNNDKIEANNSNPIWNANKLLGRPVDSGSPNDGDYLAYNSGSGTWEHTALSGGSSYTADGLGLELSGTVFGLEIDTSGDTVLQKSHNGLTALNDSAWWNARKIQGVAIDAGAAVPTNGDVLVYSSGTSQWESQAPSGSSYSADGNGIEEAGGVFSLELDGDTLSKSASGLKLTRSSQWLSPTVFLSHDQVTPGPEQAKMLKGSGASAVATHGLNYDYQDDEYASTVVGVPVDGSENPPAQVRLSVHVIGKASPGAGTDAVFGTSVGTTGGNGDIVEDGDAFVVTWGNNESHTFTVSTSNVSILTSAAVNLESSLTTVGHLNIKISRLAASDGNDDFEEDVTFLGCLVEWIW